MTGSRNSAADLELINLIYQGCELIGSSAGILCDLAQELGAAEAAEPDEGGMSDTGMDMPAKAPLLLLPTRGTLIKAAGVSGGYGKLEGFAARYSDDRDVDLAGDFFDAGTDYGIQPGQEVPLLWHHGLDRIVGKQPIGKGRITPMAAGLWFQAWMSMRTDYERAIYAMAEAGKLGFSSATDPDTLTRIPVRKGVSRIARWHIKEVSATPVPCDPKNVLSVNLKSLMSGRERAARLTADLDALELADLDAAIAHARDQRVPVTCDSTGIWRNVQPPESFASYWARFGRSIRGERW